MKAPAADRKVLVLMAGIVWSLVGAALIVASIHWLRATIFGKAIVIMIGILGGAIIYRYGFSNLARKNISRIYEQAPGKDKVCLFAFQNKRSYIIVTVMILMGYSLRHSPIPKIFLSPLYMAIGLGLFLASLIYYRRILSKFNLK